MKKIYKAVQSSIIILCFYLIIKKILAEDANLSIFSNLEPHLLILGVFFSAIVIFLYGSLVYKILKLLTNVKLKVRAWFYIFLNSQFLDSIPFTGFIYKAFRLKKIGLSYSNFFSSYIFIFFTWMISSSLLFFLQLVFLSLFLNQIKIFYISLLIMFFNLTLIFSFKFIKFLIKKKFIELFLINKIYDIFKFVDLNLKIKNIMLLVKFSFFIQIFEFTLYIISAYFFQYDLDLINIYEIFLVISIVGFFPITPKNIGISELVAGALLSYQGFNFIDGVMLQIFVRVLYLISVALLFSINNLLFINKKYRLRFIKNVR